MTCQKEKLTYHKVSHTSTPIMGNMLNSHAQNDHSKSITIGNL